MTEMTKHTQRNVKSNVELTSRISELDLEDPANLNSQRLHKENHSSSRSMRSNLGSDEDCWADVKYSCKGTIKLEKAEKKLVGSLGYSIKGSVFCSLKFAETSGWDRGC